jgi:serine-type D-Ala-D-Ala carboxypeptidase
MATRLRYGEPEEVGMSGSRIKRLARLAEGWVADGSHQALVVLAARRGVIVLHEAFGKLTPEPDAPPVALDTIFPVASISKPITAATALTLVDDGLLGLNRPVQEYLPEFVGDGKEAVMVHHLLTHTSGFEDEAALKFVDELRAASKLPDPTEPDHPLYAVFPLWRYVATLFAAPLVRPPGQQMAYSNLAYALLGDIVSRVAAVPFAQAVQDRVFAPLAMSSSSFDLTTEASARMVRRPVGIKGDVFELPNLPRHVEPPGGVRSTAHDMAVFGQMLLNGGGYGDARLLSPASVREMTRNQIPGVSASFESEIFPEAAWGLGVGVHGNKKSLRDGSLHSPAALSHGGAGGTQWWVDPVYEIVGVYFSVALNYYPTMMEKWNADLFVNAVTAAVEE